MSGGRRTLRAVVDTNVWVSGLIVPDSPPGLVLQAIRDGRIEVVASWALLEEIIEVLRRPKLRPYEITEADVQDVAILLSPGLPTVDLEVTLRDEDDAPVVSSAVAGRVEAIVTGDLDILDDAGLRSWLAERAIAVLRPVDALARLG